MMMSAGLHEFIVLCMRLIVDISEAKVERLDSIESSLERRERIVETTLKEAYSAGT